MNSSKIIEHIKNLALKFTYRHQLPGNKYKDGIYFKHDILFNFYNDNEEEILFYCYYNHK
jgi:hypothetical protein